MRDDTRIVGQRMQALRESADLSQNMLAKALGIQQPSIYRYETGRTAVPMNVMLLYAEFFDVSLDYIYGRTENRHGMYFSAEPHLERCNPEMDKFIEMCFEPGSAAGAKLKETLKRMMKESIPESKPDAK